MKKIPKYKSLRIFIISGIFYFFLVMPFILFVFIQKYPNYVEQGLITDGAVSGNIGLLQFSTDSLPLAANIRDSVKAVKIDSLVSETINYLKDSSANQQITQTTIDSIVNTATKTIEAQVDQASKPGYLAKSFDLFFNGLFISLFISYILSIPFRRYFIRKRRAQAISPRLEFFCRRFLIHTPLIHSSLYGLAILITISYIGYVNFYVDKSQTINAGIFDEYFYIAALSGFLSTLFVYYWHKHRVHIFYLEVLYNEDELRKRIFRKSIGKIRSRLWLASGMTTLLPLAIVIFYLVLSITQIKDLDINLSNEISRKILIGDYTQLFTNADLSNYYYVNSMNALMMFIGIGISIFISLVYILTFVRWTTLDIVFPVKELLGNMQKTGEGKTTNFSIVRTNDEIGELAEGFNLMSQRIKNYIDDISEINNSYYRFVPKQFLDFLDKKSITDIHLGDQIQKEMTVMFSDIRSFTEISENMTPRDNFNFINHYLGYMEPIISRNHGFIDKYIGDAIMALFPESPDDAINAAIEMRAKLYEFNEDLKLNGKKAINSGIGINTGNLMLGIVGGKGRIEGTVISDHVNLASRLEGLTKKYGSTILISQDTLIKLDSPENYKFRFLDTVKVKGKRNSVNIFEIIDGDTKILRDQKTATKAEFTQAIQLYQSKKIDEALVIFQKISQKSPDDMATLIYLQRCQYWIKNGLPKAWDGSESWE